MVFDSFRRGGLGLGERRRVELARGLSDYKAHSVRWLPVEAHRKTFNQAPVALSTSKLEDFVH
jgi:hypothetical protein